MTFGDLSMSGSQGLGLGLMGSSIGLNLVFGSLVLPLVLGSLLLICYCQSFAGGPVIIVGLGFREDWYSSGSDIGLGFISL